LTALRRSWWLVLILGLLSIVVGMLAISSTFVATLASVTVIGWLLIIAGIIEVVHAVAVHNWRGFALHLLAAALYLMAGLFMLEDPIQAAAVLTLLLAAVFIVGGALRILLSLIMRFPGWPWLILNGVIDLALGIMIWNRWPASSLWVIGLFVGIDLLFHGWSEVVLALSVRNFVASKSD
jgi:uncharacterized membrane protein HdeD (DUF308 family)